MYCFHSPEVADPSCKDRGPGISFQGWELSNLLKPMGDIRPIPQGQNPSLPHLIWLLPEAHTRRRPDRPDLTDLTERVLRDWTLPRGRNQSIYFTSEVGKQMGQNETKPAKGREAALQKSAVLAAATRRREAGEPASGRPGPSGGGKRRGSEASTTQERDAWRTGGAHTATVPSAQDRHAWPGGTQAEAQEDPRISQASWREYGKRHSSWISAPIQAGFQSLVQ
ncbi:uncharacterized protein LOC102151918 isoform X18 [Canis lupus familiaris]|uniref:uncharacterized protein LOC102151918 isoform X18 n=1 Tax=Canis lupus familiaris TaxID=9615 RepID=UPI0018F57AD2|nr:uncharacterized protein LOC102151918 isoform X18 [Canis lupus familiaris]